MARDSGGRRDPHGTGLTPVDPARPVAPYVGGKRNLARRLIALIEATPHTTYIEPFVGMGGVFLRRRSRPACEIINDLSGDVANLFRCIRAHPDALVAAVEMQLQTRADFDRHQRQDPTLLTDIQRAARFLYLQKVAFGGMVTGREFGMSRDRPSRFRPSQVREDVRAAAARLDGCEADYGADLFGRDQFAAMADQLGRLKGRFILSLNDRPEVREIFAAFDIESIDTHYGLAPGSARPAREVIITGGG